MSNPAKTKIAHSNIKIKEKGIPRGLNFSMVHVVQARAYTFIIPVVPNVLCVQTAFELHKIPIKSFHFLKIFFVVLFLFFFNVVPSKFSIQKMSIRNNKRTRIK